VLEPGEVLLEPGLADTLKSGAADNCTNLATEGTPALFKRNSR
jgi:hypothetical protein